MCVCVLRDESEVVDVILHQQDPTDDIYPNSHNSPCTNNTK